MKVTFESPGAAWRRLHETLDDYDIALFVGAGVSYPSGVPAWEEFVATLGGWSDSEMQRFGRAGLSTTALCGIARGADSVRVWTSRVREAIYRKFLSAAARKGILPGDFDSRDVTARKRVDGFFRNSNPVLWSIVRACGVSNGDSVKKNDQIGALLSTNVDGLLQICDRAIHGSRVLRTVERACIEGQAEKIPLYQLHGYLLPTGRPSSEAADGLVLTEADYVARTDDPYSWANVALHWAVREFPVVFMGCSMNDDLIRRALHRSCRERMKHYAAKKGGRPAGENVWRRHFVVMRVSGDKRVDRARNESAATLGLWPLWVKDYGRDLPARIGAATGRS